MESTPHLHDTLVQVLSQHWIWVEETAKGLRQRQQRDAQLREVDELVKERWDNPDGAEQGG